MDELERQGSALIAGANPPPLATVVARAAKLRRRRRSVAAATACVVFVGGGLALFASSDDLGAEQVDTIDQAPPTVVTSTTVDPESIMPSTLPDRGLAIETADGVELIGLSGDAIASMPGYRLTGNWRPDHGVRLEDPSGAAVMLDVSAGALRPATAVEPETPSDWPDLPAPASTPDVSTVVGHWRWVLDAPSGGHRLAQWSSECEIPMALVIGPDGVARSAFGGTWTSTPTSVALGWTVDGRAVVHVTEAACGQGIRAGVYLVDLDGNETFLAEAVAAQFWQRDTAAAPPSRCGPSVASDEVPPGCP